jgi:hypothetical protein
MENTLRKNWSFFSDKGIRKKTERQQFPPSKDPENPVIILWNVLSGKNIIHGI